MRFVSLCSGIEAASVAFGPLGWSAVAFSEIEPFPCAVLAHHYPHVPNMGDMTRFREWPERIWLEADAIVAGTPCQAFSVAGKRAGLDDARGNLTLIFVELIDHADRIRRAHGLPPVVILWENVPGVLSSADNAFGCLLAGLAGEDEPLVGARGKWSNAGCVLGPSRAVAWRSLDAQYFGLAQRRRRVFVVASARQGFDPGSVLFEFDGVRRDLAPRREAPEDAAGTLAGGARGRGGYSYDDVPLTAPTLDASYGRLQGCSGQDANRGHSSLVPHTNAVAAWGGNRSSGPRDTSTALTAHSSGTRLDFESDTFVTQRPDCIVFKAGAGAKAASIAASETTSPTLGACPSGNNSVPSVAIGFNARQDPDSWADRVGPLDTDGGTQAVAFDSRQDCVSSFHRWGALGSATPQAQAIAYAIQEKAVDPNPNNGPQSKGYQEGLAYTMEARPRVQAVATPMAVRRLTPEECEALQGFRRGYTRIVWRGKPADLCPDGPRYKALGNSWAVPCVAWIARRITEQLQ